ncbi:hypothetical protein [Paenibacillus dendritiformis]|uniref:hypothetical protein n=1 Tax=Paenibacillus dendritiformis TaxID=130049 RepID=UPI000DA7FE27|nr:hypothetical protein [Paenibacillus dendritiformis]PZM62596.1 hypothetical protein DOE73_26425 [Paenibacillus dendritiformis]
MSNWYDIQAVKDFIALVSKRSPRAFISCRFELIVEPKNNIYFRLGNIQSEMDLKAKVLAWLSRPSCKGVSNYYQKIIRGIVNEYLGTSFTQDEMDVVYTRLGNDCNRDLCVKFIESGYDLAILQGGLRG